MRRRSLCVGGGWLCFWCLTTASAWAQQQPVAVVVTPANSELTVRTTSSADIQVCAPPGVLSDRRAALQTLCLAQLRYLLSQTTAVYLVRASTTALGAVCWVYVYQAPSPAAAANAEFLLSQQTGLGLLTLTDDVDGQPYACTTHVVPWQGEGPPLSPVWDISASDLILYGAIVGGGLALLLLVLCAFVLAAQSADAQQLKRYNNRQQHRQRGHRAHHQSEQLHSNHDDHEPPPSAHDHAVAVAAAAEA